MDVGQALRFPFADRRNLGPLLVGLAFALGASLPFAADGPARLLGGAGALLFALVGGGYGMRLTRRVADGEQTLLPAWRDWRGMLVEGFRFFVVFIAWFLLFMLIAGLAVVGFLLVVGFEVDRGWVNPAPGSWTDIASSAAIFFLANLLLVPSLARTAVEESIEEGLRLPTIVGTVRRHFGVYVLAAFAIALFQLAQSSVGLALAALGWGETTLPSLILGAILALYAGLFSSHIGGQAYRRSHAPEQPLPPPSRALGAAT